MLNDVVDVVTFDHQVVGNETRENLHVMQFPTDAVLVIEDVGITHGLEAIDVTPANGDLVLAIEHEAEAPIVTGAGTVMRFLLVDGKRSMEKPEGRNDPSGNLFVVEVMLTGDEDIVGVTGIDHMELAKSVCDLMVNGNHHQIRQHGTDGSSLREPAIQQAEGQHPAQKYRAVRNLDDFTKRENSCQLIEQKVFRSGAEEVGEVQLQEPSAAVLLMTLQNINGTAIGYIGEGAGMVEGEELRFKERFQLIQCSLQLIVGSIDPAETTGFLRNMEARIQLAAVSLEQFIMMSAKGLQLLNQFGDGDLGKQPFRDVGNDSRDGIPMLVRIVEMADIHLARQHLFKGELTGTGSCVSSNIGHIYLRFCNLCVSGAPGCRYCSCSGCSR